MSLDALFLKELTCELQPLVQNLRIEKIQMPSKDLVVLVLRGNKRLLLCCNPNQARIHITEQIRDNPMQPPMFCMLLRKYIGNGLIIDLQQEPLERVVTLTIQAADEMGEISNYRLIVELLGRHSNIILVDQTDHIIDAIHHVDFEMCPERQIMPGLLYRLPMKKEVRNLLTIEKEEFISILPKVEVDAVKWFTSNFIIAPLSARELLFRAYGETSVCIIDEKIWEPVEAWRKEVRKPYLLSIDGKYYDFTDIPILQYGFKGECGAIESYSMLLDTFFEKKEQQEVVRTKGQDLLKTVTNLIHRTEKKIALQQKDLEATKNRDTYRLYGELITANLYQMKENCGSLTCQNFYDENLSQITIPLDNKISPQKNAQKYFKQYTKAKTAESILSKRIEEAKEQLNYLLSVQHEIQMSELEQDFIEIRQELLSQGFLKKKGSKEQKGKGSKPRRFLTSQGLTVLVGRNNQMNEKLSLKMAGKQDIWFHTKSVHGSHVLLCVDDVQPNEQSIFEAATIAAYYSQGRDGGKLTVDYTPAKYLKKPSGGYPGMVIYHTNTSMDVIADEKLVKGLAYKC